MTPITGTAWSRLPALHGPNYPHGMVPIIKHRSRHAPSSVWMILSPHGNCGTSGATGPSVRPVQMQEATPATAAAEVAAPAEAAVEPAAAAEVAAPAEAAVEPAAAAEVAAPVEAAETPAVATTTTTA